MGNKDSIVTQSSLQTIENIQIVHLGQTTLMKNKQAFCLLKVYSFSDNFLMEQKLRKFKTRVNKLSQNSHVLNIYSVNKIQKKQICANNYQLLVYMQKYESTLSEMINRRLKEKKNFNQKQLFQFLIKVVQTLIYIQDNGLKNIQLDGEAILFCQNSIKILDCSIACSKTYYKLLQERQKGIYCNNNRIYLAPQLLKDLKQLNYDPYISPKADIFSLGMLLFQMVTLQPMHGYYDYFNANIDYQSLIHRLSRINHSLNLKTLLAQMLQYDPDQRIGLVSLKQKIEKLNYQNSESMPRSKSSKMLKEFLSQSRNSAVSSKNAQSHTSMKRQQSTQRKNKIQLHLTNTNHKTSRQLFSEGQKQKNKKQIQKISLNSKQKVQQNQKQPTLNANPYQNSMDNIQFKNMVKNKLTRNKEKQNENQKQEQNGYNSKMKIKYNQFGKLSHNMSKIILQEKNNNQFQSSFNKRNFEMFLQSKGLQQSKYNETCLKKLVQDSKVNKLLKIQNLDVNAKKSTLQQSIKHTSRFGYSEINSQTESLDGQIGHCEKRKASEVYLQEQNELQLQQQLKRFQDKKIKNKPIEHQKQLNKVMTFNKQFSISARSIQSSNIPNQQHKYHKVTKRLSQYAMPNQQQLIQSKFGELQESPCMKLTIKDVPVVISQQKNAQQKNKQILQTKLNRLQKHFNMMDYVDSIEQDNSNYSSNLNGSSKVISSYKFNTYQGDYSSIKTNECNLNELQQNSCFIKKGKSKKPQLNILINDQENYYSGDRQKDIRRQLNNNSNQNSIHKTTYLKENNIYKPKAIENLSNFASVSPIHQEKDNSHSEFLYINQVKQYSNFQNQSMGNLFNKIILKNGQIYQGQLSRQGIPNGNGILEYQKYYKYSGSFRLGKFNGYGTLINLKPSNEIVDFKCIDLSKGYWVKFEGQFQNGSKNGFGTIFFNGGQKFSGCLKRDVIQGYGCYYKRNGQLISGLWVQNNFKKI